MSKTEVTEKWQVPSIVILFGVLFILALVIVTGLSAATRTVPEDSVQITTTSPMSNTAIPITVGNKSQFTITLPSNRTTGYEWKIAGKYDSKVVKLLSNTYVEPQKPMPGKGNVENWTFQAVGKGTTTIVMNYIRPWEPKPVPAMTQKFTITVQ